MRSEKILYSDSYFCIAVSVVILLQDDLSNTASSHLPPTSAACKSYSLHHLPKVTCDMINRPVHKIKACK